MTRCGTASGEQGASATWIIAPGRGSWNSFSTRSLSSTIVSESCTIVSGCRPPSVSEMPIEPRVTVMRRPSAFASSTSMSIALSRPGGKRL